MNAVSCALLMAPTLVAASWPSLNSISVGMPRMPNLAGAAPFGPVVHQHGGAGLQHVGFKAGVRDMFDEFAGHGGFLDFERVVTGVRLKSGHCDRNQSHVHRCGRALRRYDSHSEKRSNQWV